jgi:preprotein translocase subunit SecD
LVFGTIAIALFGIGAATAQPLQLKLRAAEPGFDLRSGQPLVSFRMTDESARDFARFTTENVSRKVDFRVDGKTLMQPVVREPITGGAGQVLVSSVDEGKSLAERLAKGTATLEVEVSKD